MKAIKICSFLIFFISFSVMTFAQNQPCKNHIKNPKANDHIDHWTIEGDYARVIEKDNNNNYAWSTWNTSGGMSGFTQHIKVDKQTWGQDCTVSGWLRRGEVSDDELGQPLIRANFQDKNGITLLSKQTNQETSSEWTLRKFTASIPKGTARIQIRLKVDNNSIKTIQGGGWKAYFDNVAVTRCGRTLERPGS